MRGRRVPEMSEDTIRELFVKSCRLYEVRDQDVVILTCLHGARRFPTGSSSSSGRYANQIATR
jgi:hypothetical protein